MNLDEAQAEYDDARAAASDAYRAARQRADARMAKAIRLAGPKGTLTREEVAQYVAGTTIAAQLARDILAGPTEDLDRALAEAKKAPHD